MLSQIEAVFERRAGGFLVADLHIPWVRVHDAEGGLVRILGQFGEGPGEFRNPAGAVETPEGIYVTDQDLGRITRFTSDLEYDTTFAVSGHPQFIESLGDELFVQMVRHPSGMKVHRLNEEMIPVRSFMTGSPVIEETPYWGSVTRTRGTVIDDQILVLESLLYPVWRFDREGNDRGTFGTEPPSWRQASKPEFAAFVGPDAGVRQKEWLDSFTAMDGIYSYRDSLVLIAHAYNRPGATSSLAREQYALDGYLADGAKVLEDVELPGPIVGSGEFVYVILRQPPEAWTIGAYEYR